MSISEIVIKGAGIALVIAGLALIFAAFGVSLLGLHLSPWWVEAGVGFISIAAGVVLIRGGSFGL